jgi:putative nucleotidyltransferase with HDIG domain
MKETEFKKIANYIGEVIKDSPFHSHTYIVGGSVRDLCMGNEIKDIDLVIDLENGGIEFAKYCMDKELLTHDVVLFERYGVAMFAFKEFPNEQIECVMTRGEKYLDRNSRNPETVFAGIEDDCIRRDLTINALYYNISTGEIVDMVGGLKDIENKVIRTTNENPDIVFDDDPLRVLRVCRFSTRYGWDIEPKTYESMKKYVDRLEIISKERINDEFNKILLSDNAVMGIRTLCDIGAMKYIIPEVDEMIGMEQNAFHFGDVFEHTMALLDYDTKHFKDEDIAVRLALLLHDIGKIKTRTVGDDGRVHFYEHEFAGSEMVVDILKRLKYDNKTIDIVKFLVKNHMRTKNFGNGCVKIKTKSFNKLAYTCKNEYLYKALARVIECDNNSHKAEHNITGHYDYLIGRIDDAKKMFNYKLPVNGNDVMDILKISGGVLVKKVLDKLINHAFSNPDALTRESCIKQIPYITKELVKSDMKLFADNFCKFM